MGEARLRGDCAAEIQRLPEILDVSSHEQENVFPGDWNNLRVGGAGPCAADLYGLASPDRELVSAEIS
jgi:hypothetical protein